MDDATPLDRWQRATSVPMIVAGVLFLVAYSVEVLARPEGSLLLVIDIATAAIWLVFVVDYLAKVVLARPRGRWVLSHLHELAIVLVPPLRPLVLIRLVPLLERSRVGTAEVRTRVLVYTGSSAALVLYVGALALLQFEREANGPIGELGDALWWGVATITTVGYGDFVPVTVGGRLVGIVLMIVGIAMIGILAGSLSSWVMEFISTETARERAATRGDLDRTAAEIAALRDEVVQLRRQTSAAAGAELDGTGPATRR